MRCGHAPRRFVLQRKQMATSNEPCGGCLAWFWGVVERICSPADTLEPHRPRLLTPEEWAWGHTAVKMQHSLALVAEAACGDIPAVAAPKRPKALTVGVADEVAFANCSIMGLGCRTPLTGKRTPWLHRIVEGVETARRVGTTLSTGRLVARVVPVDEVWDLASEESGQLINSSPAANNDDSASGSSSLGTSVSATLSTDAEAPFEASRKMEARLVDATIVKQPKDGTCLFHSIAHGLGDGTSGIALRKQIVNFILTQPSTQIASTTVKDWIKMTAGKSPHAYTKELACQGAWGGALELAIAARIKCINIDVYERCGTKYRCVTTFKEPGARRTVSVLYNTKPFRHYDALVVQKAKV